MITFSAPTSDLTCYVTVGLQQVKITATNPILLNRLYKIKDAIKSLELSGALDEYVLWFILVFCVGRKSHLQYSYIIEAALREKSQ